MGTDACDEAIVQLNCSCAGAGVRERAGKAGARAQLGRHRSLSLCLLCLNHAARAEPPRLVRLAYNTTVSNTLCTLPLSPQSRLTSCSMLLKTTPTTEKASAMPIPHRKLYSRNNHTVSELNSSQT